MGDYTHTVQSFSPAKRALLDLRMKQQEGKAEGKIGRRRQRERAPLSYAQQRLWFLQRLEPENPSYHVYAAVKLRGRLNVEALQRSLGEIVRRHEVLRTRFVEEGEQVVQEISGEWRVEVPAVDLSGRGGEEREQETVRLAIEEARTPFDLARGGLFRVRRLQLGEEENVVLVTMHHIVSDGWSVGVLVRELGQLYAAYARGEESGLAELEIQYGDFAAWQREYLQGEVLEEQMKYWRQQLGGELPVLELPTDHGRPAVRSYRGGQHRFRVEGGVVEKLKELSRREGATLFMTLLAVFEVLLTRYSGQEDIVVGTPIANRPRVETEELIGFFVNTLVLRTDVRGNPTMREVLERVKRTAVEAYAHQDVPFERLVEELQPKRDLSRTALFQVMFVLQNAPVGEMESLPGLKLSGIEYDREVAKFDLSLAVGETSGGLEGMLEYNTDLFERETMERMAGHWVHLLEQVAEDGGRRVWELELMRPAERRQVVEEWNRTAAAFPCDKTIHALITEQAHRTPHQVALVCEAQQVTFAEFNRRTNQLARRLRSWGIGPEVMVGVCMTRSIEQMIGAIAILKAGGCYVPIEPDYPSERLHMILEDTAAPVVLTNKRHAGRLGNIGKRVFSVDVEWSDVADESGEDFDGGATAQNLAYVLYTSGSTGRPKGVMVEHRSVVNYVTAVAQRYQLKWCCSYAMLQPLTVDSCLTTMLPPLMFGGALHLITAARASDPQALGEYFRQHQIDLLKIAPSHLSALRASKEPSSVLPRSLLVIGGESSRRDWAESLLQDGGCSVFNHYGPTEATVGMLTYPVTKADLRDCPEKLLLGRPLANCEAYVVDRQGNPLPVGIPGELWIGGECVARGYLHRSELTAEKFVSNPFSQRPGARVYKTGDLVRLRADGNIEFLGRADQQVKIRGFRIELGEVEAALAKHPSIVAIVVLAKTFGGEGLRLIAYFVSSVPDAPTASDLRKFLRDKLPAYMLPSSFIQMADLPRTRHGKVDLNALPVPEHRYDLDSNFVAPRNECEKLLAELWCKVLEVHEVGIHDNFFELGGHSLLATRVVSHIREALKVDLAVISLFESPTIAELAMAVSKAQAREQEFEKIPRKNRPMLATLPGNALQSVPGPGTSSAPATIAALSPAKRALLDLRMKQQEGKAEGKIGRRRQRERAPLSYAQQRLWFLQQLEPENPSYHVYAAVKLRGRLNVEALQRSLGEIVRRHEVLRTRFVEEGEQVVQEISGEWRVEVPAVDLSGRGGEEREQETVRLAIEEARTPFDLARGGLFRVRRLQLGEEENVVLVTMHHIVSDGWSVGVLVRELGQLYAAYARGEESGLAELEIQYGDFAAWQREYLQGEVLEEQMKYWRQQLGGELPVLELPTDHGRPAVRSYRGGQHRFRVEGGVVEKLKELSRREGATLFMTLLAVFEVLLTRYSGQEDIVVGTPIANRPRVETEELIGFFVNTLVLRTDVRGNPTMREVLERVKRTAVEAYAHQDVPFERLVEELQPKRDLSRTALFQVMFVLQNAPVGEMESLPGLKLSGIEYDREVAKFDLSLAVGETSGGLEGMLEYNTDLFERETMERMAGHWVHLLEQVAEDGGRRVWELELMRPAERRQVVEEWNRTAAAFPCDKTIVDLIEEQVVRTPERTALIFEERRLTYVELNAKATQLARWLCQTGVTRESTVAVQLHRSVEMVVALLAILKAGGSYVPLDPDFPRRRLQLLLEDIGAAVVLTDAALRSALPETSARVLALDTEWSEVEASVSTEEQKRIKPLSKNAAYVIFTSGSTGQPKGVINTHLGLCNRLWWMQEQYKLGAQDVVLQKTPYTFDVSIWEFFWPLMAGATLVISRPYGHRDPRYLADIIARQRVTTLHFVPSMLAAFLDEADLELCRSIRRVICSGEELSVDLQDRFVQRMPWAELDNLYGPTEAAIDVTSWRCRPQPGSRSVPIGCPISNIKIHILDEYRNPVPVGVDGELHIGGIGLARGYLKRPELTAKKFIPNPFVKDETLYRTGDRARYRSDGTIEYRGRLDFQVKLRGFRVEPGEVEFHMRRHPAVRDTVVVARGRSDAEKRLVAYIVLHSASDVSPTDLRKWLKDSVPDYMIPAAFVMLDQLPLGGNGKVDRGKLPEAEVSRGDGEYIEPASELERTIAGIWGDVLRMEKVGATDNFFSLGGHSLLATQVVSRLRNTLCVEVPLAAIFQAPTVGEFAALVSKLQASFNSNIGPNRRHLQPTRRAQAARRMASLEVRKGKELLNPVTASGRQNE